MSRVEIDQIREEILRRLEQNAPAEAIELTRNGEVIGHLTYLGKLTTISPEFFDPMPEDFLRACNGEDE